MQYVHAYFALVREAYKDLMDTVEHGASHGFILASAVMIPVFGSLFFFAILVSAAPYTPPTPTTLIETTQTSSTTFNVVLSENNTPLNAVEIELFFNPQAFLVRAVTIHETLCEKRFVLTKEINNTNGHILYQCGTITPFVGTSTTLATIDVMPLEAGTSTITFGPNTNTLAHDGYGTNVTKERLPGIFSYEL